MRFVALTLIASIALAGCGSVQQDQHFTVPDDAPSSADTYTGDGYNLRIKVTDENGTPLAGAAVVLFTMSGLFGGEASAEAGSGGARAVAYWEADFNSYDMVAGLRTDAEGWASADLEPNTMIHVAAGDVAGMTTEVRANVALASGGQTGSVTVPLYPDHVSYTFDIDVGNHVGRAGLMQGEYESFELLLADGDAHDAYTDRIYNIDGSITWTNGPTEGADYHIGVGGQDGPMWEGSNAQQVPMDGQQTETIQVASGDLDGHREALAEGGYYLHVITDWVSLSFDGVDVTVTVDADLKGSNIVIN